MNTTISLHGVVRVQRTTMLFNDFVATRLVVTAKDGSTCELNLHTEHVLDVEEKPFEDYRKVAA